MTVRLLFSFGGVRGCLEATPSVQTITQLFVQSQSKASEGAIIGESTPWPQDAAGRSVPRATSWTVFFSINLTNKPTQDGKILKKYCNYEKVSPRTLAHQDQTANHAVAL